MKIHIHLHSKRVHVSHAKRVKDVKRGGRLTHISAHSDHNTNLERLRSSLQKLSLNSSKASGLKRRYIRI